MFYFFTIVTVIKRLSVLRIHRVVQHAGVCLQWPKAVVLNLSCLAAWMGSAQFICSPDPTGGLDLVPGMMGPHLAVQKGLGASLAPTEPCGGRELDMTYWGGGGRSQLQRVEGVCYNTISSLQG